MWILKTTQNELHNELLKIERQIDELKRRKKEIRRKIKENDVRADPKISISISNGKYLIGKTRVKDKVVSVHVGNVRFYSGRNDPKAYEDARKKMLIKLNPDLHILYIPYVSFLKNLVDTELLEFIHTEPLRRPFLQHKY